MKKIKFIVIIGISSAFFFSFLLLDELYVPDRGMQQIYETALLGVMLAFIGITASSYYGDSTANTVIKDLKKLVSELDQKIKNLESKFENLHNSKD